MDLLTDLLFQLARTKIIWLLTGMLSFLVCLLLHFVCRPNIVGSGGMCTTFMCSCLATSSLCFFATEMMFVGGRIMQLWPNFVLVLFYFILFCFILTYFISRLQIILYVMGQTSVPFDPHFFLWLIDWIHIECTQFLTRTLKRFNYYTDNGTYINCFSIN